jgi:hypothetical protein
MMGGRNYVEFVVHNMSMGIVSDEDFMNELNNSAPKYSLPTLVIGQVIDQAKPGRKEGDVNTPNIIRQIIGEEAIEGNRSGALDIAKRYGISASSVSAYSNGATSTASYHTPNAELNNSLDNTKSRVVKRARNRMMMALNAITPEKLESAKVRDAASVAKDMSAIIRNIEPPAPMVMNDNGPKFVLYAPQFIKESSLPVIEVND